MGFLLAVSTQMDVAKLKVGGGEMAQRLSCITHWWGFYGKESLFGRHQRKGYPALTTWAHQGIGVSLQRVAEHCWCLLTAYC